MLDLNSRRGRLSLYVVVLLAALACSRSFKGSIVSYHVEAPPGVVASDERLDSLAKAINARLRESGFDGALAAWSGRVRVLKVLVPDALVARQDEILRNVEQTVATLSTEGTPIRLEHVATVEQK